MSDDKKPTIGSSPPQPANPSSAPKPTQPVLSTNQSVHTPPPNLTPPPLSFSKPASPQNVTAPVTPDNPAPASNPPSSPPSSPTPTPTSQQKSPHSNGSGGGVLKKLLALAVVLAVIGAGIAAGVYLTSQNQDIRRDALETFQSAEAVCTPDMFASIRVSFANKQPDEPQLALRVLAVDEQTGEQVDMGIVEPGESKTATLTTTNASLLDGVIRFDLTWADGRTGSDTKYANYVATGMCAQETDDIPNNTDDEDVTIPDTSDQESLEGQQVNPSPSPSASPSATPIGGLSPTPKPTATPTPSPTPKPSPSPTLKPTPTPATPFVEDEGKLPEAGLYGPTTSMMLIGGLIILLGVGILVFP